MVQPLDGLKASIFNNPFHLIGATVRDGRQKIMELEEEKSLIMDHEICAKARVDLTNPRTRLSYEIAWLPGVSPKQATLLLHALETHPDSIKNQNVPMLAFANLLSSLIENLNSANTVDTWVDYICELANVVDEVDACEIMNLVNEDRVVSGFPEVKSLETVESELLARRQAFKDAVINALDKLPTTQLVEVVTEIVNSTSDYGNTGALVLVDELVDAYEIKAHGFLEKEADNILRLVEIAQEDASEGEPVVETVVSRLCEALRRWDRFAQPIQVSMKSRGLRHELSHKLARTIRSLGIGLFNNHGLLKQSQAIVDILHEVFAELGEIAEMTTSDKEILSGIEREQKEIKELTEEIAGNKVYQVLISADSITYSKLCTCCLSDDNLTTEDISYSWEEDGAISRTKYTRSFKFPICAECLKHRSEYTKKRWIIALVAAMISTLIGYFVLSAQNYYWFNMAIVSSILTAIAAYLICLKVKLSILPAHHACRADSVEMSSATSKFVSVFNFHNPIYAKAFAEANGVSVQTVDVKKPPRGERILQGKGALSLFVSACVLGIIIMSVLRN